MKILILGGSRFVGRTFAEASNHAGHEITLFNRGISGPGVLSGAREIVGDRCQDLSPLDGLTFDAVFDSCGYFPRVVEASAKKLGPSVGRYVFISSISVLKDSSVTNQGEDADLADDSELYPEEVSPSNYGPLKVQCEKSVKAALGEKATIVRPGLIVGPNDTTDRFTYWPVRFAEGGEVLLPNLKSQPVQFIDVRDLAQFCLGLISREVGGTFNATGPAQPYRFEEVIDACATGMDARKVWVDPEFLEQEGVSPWSDLPLSLARDGGSNGMLSVNIDRAIGERLELRPLVETVADTRVWASNRPQNYEWKAGLTRNREKELLTKWKERH